MQKAKSWTAALVVIALLIGAAGGYFLGISKAKSLAAEAVKVKMGELSAKWLQAQGLNEAATAQAAAMTRLDGEVLSVGADSLEIKSLAQTTNPFADPLPETRTVKLADGAKIYLSEPVSAEEIQTQMAAYEDALRKFEKNMSAGAGAQPTEAPMPPASEKRTEIKMKDVQKNDYAMITAADDITYATTITATEIVVSRAPALQAEAAPAAPKNIPVPESAPAN